MYDKEGGKDKTAKQLFEKIGSPRLTWKSTHQCLFPILSHPDPAVRSMAAHAIAFSVETNKIEMKTAAAELHRKWEEMVPPPEKEGWEQFQDGDVPLDKLEKEKNALGRAGIAICYGALVPLMSDYAQDSTQLLRYLFDDQALADDEEGVRKEMLEAGIKIIRVHSANVASQVALPFLEGVLSQPSPSQKGNVRGGGHKLVRYELLQEGAMILLCVSAVYLNPNDRRLGDVMSRIMEALNTPSQDSVSELFSELAKTLHEKTEFLAGYVKILLDRLRETGNEDIRRGAALGIAAVVFGLGVPALRRFNILQTLQRLAGNKKSANARCGGLLAYIELCRAMRRGFDPYSVSILPHLLQGFGDSSPEVRMATTETAKVLLGGLSGVGIKMVLPGVLKGLRDKNWRTKKGSVEMLGAMSHCAPKQLSQCLPLIVPQLQTVLMDTHDQVCEAAKVALKEIGSVVVNPEILKQADSLFDALVDPNTKTETALNGLLQTTFVHIVDPPSLALIIPIVERGLSERRTSTKKAACRIVGNMTRLCRHHDLMPYLNRLLTGLKGVALDPIPESRETAAKALGKVVPGIGEEHCPHVIPWLLETLVSDTGTVERCGAAQGLSEILAGLQISKFEKMLPLLIRLSSDGNRPFSREGAMAMFCYLPGTLQEHYLGHLSVILPTILKGLADDAEGVREQAMEAGQATITQFGQEQAALGLLLPALEAALFNENWRIRQASVTLLGDLLEQIAAESGIEGSRLSQLEQGEAIRLALGDEKRNGILAALFMMRSDVNPAVRQKALLVWKTVAANSSKTLRQILPVIITFSIRSMSSDNMDKRQLAGKTIGSLVLKFGDEIINQVLPEIRHNESSKNAAIRLGAFLCLGHVLEHSSRQHTNTHLQGLLDSVKIGLVDKEAEVREATAIAFDHLVRKAGSSVVDSILPSMLENLTEGGEEGGVAMEGLRELISVRGHMVLPVLIPTLTTSPITPFKAKAVASLSTVAGTALNPHLGTILKAMAEQSLPPSLLKKASPQTIEEAEAALKAGETVSCAIQQQYVYLLMSEFSTAIKPVTPFPEIYGWIKFLQLFTQSTRIDLEEQYPIMLTTVLDMLALDIPDVLSACAECLGSIVKSIGKERHVEYVSYIKTSLERTQDDLKKKGKGDEIPGYSYPGVLKALMPLLTAGISQGSAEIRYDTAKSVGGIIELVKPSSLQPQEIRLIAGAIIRVVGNRFAWHVKEAMLETLVIMLNRVGDVVKTFLPMLQPLFQKGLKDDARMVRMISAVGLSKLMAYSKRVDPVVVDLLKTVEETCSSQFSSDEDLEIAEAILKALQGVFMKGGSAMNHDALVKAGLRLRSVLLHLENNANPKPQIFVLIENTALALGIHAGFMENSESCESESDAGFLSLLSLALDGLKNEAASVRSSRTVLLSALLRFCGKRLLVSLHTIVTSLKVLLSDPTPRVTVNCLNCLPNLFQNVVAPGTDDFSHAADILFPQLGTLLSHPDYDIKLGTILAIQAVIRNHSSFKVLSPYFGAVLEPLVELATNPRGYAQIRSESEKAIILLVAEKRKEGRIDETLVSVGVPKTTASSVLSLCRGKSASYTDVDISRDDFLSKI
eukprot:CAMPEP_0201503620 /NCGR_PEP_ID=MMETSP0151_2-20130828/84765_1 /ASSEMBLY_ACC=CAM_ASM_000257 /TAXON_ID=200890 /ORGANISM="Paramoeba atlantica, Strain 621/1 / CCAP 1560/9" /LENGTH=1600 /DNA_ID=CAMNT_0047897295 /DNA_START=827 /DNA_END=5629 /DNA_ORIENTATION=+